MASKSSRLYKDSPTTERDDATGKVGVVKPKAADTEDMGTTNAEGQGMPVVTHQVERREMAHRHVGERLAMHARHEGEHGGKPDEAMNTRHEEELHAMHGRHMSEMKKMNTRHEKGEMPAPADKIEAKE
jgi:hypothetical protein